MALHQFFVQRFPLGFVNAADLKSIEQRVGVVVGGGPADADPAFGGGHGGAIAVEIERISNGGALAHGGQIDGGRGALQKYGQNRRGELVVGGRAFDFIDARGDVAREVGEFDGIENGVGGGGSGERGAPLYEARGRRRGGAPGAPVIAGPVEIAAAGFEFQSGVEPVAVGRELAPGGEAAGIEDFARDFAVRFQAGAELEDFAEVAGGGEEAAARAGEQRGDLVDVDDFEGGVERWRIDAVERAFVAGAEDRQAGGDRTRWRR